MSLLDVLTGGKSDEAGDALKRAEAYYSSIPTPTVADLTLPQLQQYVQAGIMTPAEATAVLQKSNAYNNIKVDPQSMEAQVRALNELNAVGEAGGMTDEMKAQLAEALNKVNTNTRGNNAAILDKMAARGIPTSLMGTAAQLASSGQDAENANLTAIQAAGQAENNAINAMMNEGNLASTIHGQQYGEAADRAAAENAMNQWNAQAGTNTNLANAGFKQAANVYNTENKQNISNENTGLVNYRTGYNANLPQQVFNNQITKAGGMSGAATNYGNMMQKQGDQNAGLNLGLINAGVTAMSGMPNPFGGSTTGSFNPNAPQYENMLPGAAEGGMVMDEGGPVPGHSIVPGDSPRNDHVKALLSPGEIVVPRSIAPHPDAVKNFVTHLIKNKPMRPVHHEDVRTVLDALTARRAHAI